MLFDFYVRFLCNNATDEYEYFSIVKSAVMNILFVYGMNGISINGYYIILIPYSTAMIAICVYMSYI